MLPRLDSAIEREIVRLRARYQLSLDEFRGLYISDEQVDALLLSVGFEPAQKSSLPSVEAPSQWSTLIGTFELDQFESDLLLIAIAPEIDGRYSTLFAYLNDDVSARRPTIDLALRLIGDGWQTRDEVRQRLQPYARLARSGLILLEAAAARPGMQNAFSIAPIVAAHLLGGDAVTAAGLESVPDTADCPVEQYAAIADWLGSTETPPIVFLAGRQGTLRTSFAAGIAARMGRPLASLQMQAGCEPAVISQAVLACRLTGSMLLVAADSVEPQTVVEPLLTAPRPLFVEVRTSAKWERTFAAAPCLTRNFAVPDFNRRRTVWQEALRSHGLRASPSAIDAVAGRFRLPDAVIRRATRNLRISRMGDCAAGKMLQRSALMSAARSQCTLELDQLATRVDARPDWSDLVLPAEVLAHLRDFASACAQRDRVYDDWGMAQVGRSTGRGLAALFAGMSGTGKTMSAAVIARSAGLDLWRVDLSSVVSKYIGETEKNLDKIFTIAEEGESILLFDEADAIFGKRSEVRDAHDRYSNIEIAYLLQKIEDYNGISILASNFIRNIDQAFTRRLSYIIEFPVPDERLREKLWRKAFAPATPVSGAIDHAFLGSQFALTGGDIRAASLDAAFLAASDGGAVMMDHVMRAVSRQMLKQGKVPSSSDYSARAVAVGRSAQPSGIDR
jgi:hypothetical protein